MNSLIHLKGNLKEKKNLTHPGPASLPRTKAVTVDKLIQLKTDLEKMFNFWKDSVLNGALIGVYYERTVPKSKRIKTLLSKNSEASNNSIVGAKFYEREKHVIIHFVGFDVLVANISKLDKAIQILKDVFDNCITDKELKDINRYNNRIQHYGLSKSLFGDIVVDAAFVVKFDLVDNSKEIVEYNNVINCYDVGENITNILEKLGIPSDDYLLVDEHGSIRFNKKESFNVFKSNIPYLVAMSTSNMADYNFGNVFGNNDFSTPMSIPKPGNEPTIGVIDTLFDESVYFTKWVKYKDLIDANRPRESSDYKHGTAVSSIIVDGPSFNPNFDDGCGRFKVRHFGVATSGKNSSITIMRNIKKVVEENLDIHVWNLSLGSELEINPNFISAEAALLDELQCKHNIVFVVAGTNKSQLNQERIGSPADSINSLVVNAVDFDGNIASYSRKGRVLSFFTKPDICYYGGNDEHNFVVCTGLGKAEGVGTSYAAPWISRKMSYLIDVMGLTREVAKALIIDSATNWDNKTEIDPDYGGFGKVPIRIEDVINSKLDEIKFYIDGISNLYDTYAHNIPVPLYQDKYPYIAKATLCYFPGCSRNQGVDYTDTELDLYFGRITNKGTIKSINENNQSEPIGLSGVTEHDARAWYRKWDNVKHISQVLKPNSRPKSKYDNSMWGISVKAKERLSSRENGLKFGVVITLKELNGVNRIDDFIYQCSLKGWIVNKVDIENRVDVYNIAQEEIEFE